MSNFGFHKELVTNYTFVPATGKLTLNDFAEIDLDGLFPIVNATAGVSIYDPADPAKLATVAGNVITLAHNTAAMHATDALRVFYDAASLVLTDAELRASPVPVTGTFSLPAGAAQDGTDITTPTAMPSGGVGIRGWLSAIWTKLNGLLSVQEVVPTALLDGTQDGTSEAAALNGGTSLPCRCVLVQNSPTSAGNLLVGNATSQSVAWPPGYGEVIPIDNVNKVYIKLASASAAAAKFHAV